jgi:hypothetical protein
MWLGPSNAAVRLLAGQQWSACRLVVMLLHAFWQIVHDQNG